MPLRYDYYNEIRNIFIKLLNFDLAELIVNQLKFQDNLIKCEICNKKKSKKTNGRLRIYMFTIMWILWLLY